MLTNSLQSELYGEKFLLPNLLEFLGYKILFNDINMVQIPWKEDYSLKVVDDVNLWFLVA